MATQRKEETTAHPRYTLSSPAGVKIITVILSEQYFLILKGLIADTLKRFL